MLEAHTVTEGTTQLIHPSSILDPEDVHVILPLSIISKHISMCLCILQGVFLLACQPLSHFKHLSFVLQIQPGTPSLVKGRTQPRLILFILIYTTSVNRQLVTELLAQFSPPSVHGWTHSCSSQERCQHASIGDYPPMHEQHDQFGLVHGKESINCAQQ